MASRKSPRLKEIRITPEGWIYVTILAFVAVGAVLRNINLLILMAGMLVAPLIINWRLGVFWLKSISAQRISPYRTHAQQLANVQWLCHNAAHFSVWNIEIYDTLQREDLTIEDSPLRSKAAWRWPKWGDYWKPRVLTTNHSDKPSSKFNARMEIACIGGQRSEVATYRVFFTQRGCYRVGPAMLSSRFPFGLVASRILVPAEELIYVAPAIGKLSPVWERRVRSSVIGSDAVQRRRGLEEDEFYALRPWRSGDSRRQIHWRTSAKVGQPIIKQHEQPDNRDFAMLLDLHSSSNNADEQSEFDCAKCETVLSFAATVLLHLPSAVQGKIAVAICGQTSSVCRSRNHRELFEQAMHQLAIAKPTGNPVLAQSLVELAGVVSNNTPIYVISSREQASEFAFLENALAEQPLLTTDPKQEFHRILKAMWPSVRWLSVDSPEFQSMFSEVPSVDTANLQALVDKWIPENAAR